MKFIEIVACRRTANIVTIPTDLCRVAVCRVAARRGPLNGLAQALVGTAARKGLEEACPARRTGEFVYGASPLSGPLRAAPLHGHPTYSNLLD